MPQHSRILLIPLDDRPCNARFPAQVAAIASFDVALPPAASIGHYLDAGDPDAILAWLESEIGDVEAVVAAIDMLTYGGLMASRQADVTLERALQLVDRFVAITDSRVPVYAFNVLMRHSISVDSDDKARWHQQVARLSELADRMQRLGEGSLSEEIERVRKSIPEPVLTEFFAARERNHAVNRRIVELAAAGAFQFVVLGQEDCAEFGFHKAEQLQLQKLIEDCGVADKVVICPGTDELDCTLIARYIADREELQPSFYVRYATPEDALRIASFEDRPVGETIERQIAIVGGTVLDDPQDADVVLFVSGPIPTSRGALTPDEERLRRSTLEPFVDDVARCANARHNAAVADLTFANGADPALFELLQDEVLLPELISFGAWNTAANTLGTVLSHSVLRLVSLRNRGGYEFLQATGRLSDLEFIDRTADQAAEESAHFEFLFARLLDDGWYQSVVREECQRLARELGVSPYELGVAAEQVEQLARQRIEERAKSLFLAHFRSYDTDFVTEYDDPVSFRIRRLLRCDVRLPWKRCFEAEIDVDITVDAVRHAVHPESSGEHL